MLERLIIRHCAPTLAGLKTGSVINCPYKDREEILYAVQNLNQRLSFYGLFVIPLRILENKILVYLYRPDKLTEDLASEDAADILKNTDQTNEYTVPSWVIKYTLKDGMIK